jgi:hypothetical protein
MDCLEEEIVVLEEEVMAVPLGKSCLSRLFIPFF